MQQPPTCRGLRVRSPRDALVIFHAVSLRILPMVVRRLDTDERRAICSGSVFVWEERGTSGEASGIGIERWTDGIRWGPSRVRDEFLFYQEKDNDMAEPETNSNSDSDTTSRSQPGNSRVFLRQNLIKQTYSVYVDTSRGKRKWHMIAYFTQDSLDYLQSIDEIPSLASIQVPAGRYKSARSAKGRPRDHDNPSSGSGSTPNFHPTQNHQHAYSRFPPANPSRVAPQPPQRDERERHPTHRSHSATGGSAMQHQQHQYHHQQHPSPHTSPRSGECLAPLSYLRTIPPPRRHPIDEKALMALSPRFS